MPEFDCTQDGPVYRDIPGFPGYRVGADGSVWSCQRGGPRKQTLILNGRWKKLKQGTDQAGYPTVIVLRDKKRVCLFVHITVLTVFVGPRPPWGKHCCHINDNRKDNRLCNLRWGTPTDNYEDRIKNGTNRLVFFSKGENHKLAKLSVNDVREIRKLWGAGGMTQRQIGKKFGVTRNTVNGIVNFRLWAEVKDKEDGDAPAEQRPTADSSGA